MHARMQQQICAQPTIAATEELAADEHLWDSPAAGQALQAGLELVTVTCTAQNSRSTMLKCTRERQLEGRGLHVFCSEHQVRSLLQILYCVWAGIQRQKV